MLDHLGWLGCWICCVPWSDSLALFAGSRNLTRSSCVLSHLSWLIHRTSILETPVIHAGEEKMATRRQEPLAGEWRARAASLLSVDAIKLHPVSAYTLGALRQSYGEVV